MRREGGSVIVAVLVLVVFCWLSLAAGMLAMDRRHRDVDRSRMSAAAVALAEAGASKALWELRRGNAAYAGEKGSRLGAGEFTVSVRRSAGRVEITSTGVLPWTGRPRLRETVLVTAGPGGTVLGWRKF